MRLWDYLRKKLLEHSCQTVCENSYEISFGELVKETETFAKTLSEISCCAILCQSELMTAKAILACFAAGITAVPLSKRYGQIHYNKILNKVSPDALITDDTG